MPQQYSYQPDAGMLQQYYATAMPQPIAQSAPINQEQVAQYNEQDIPVAVAVPEIQNYAPQQQQMPQQQFVQQAPQQQLLQPDPLRLAYNKLIEDRFNELANKFGGVQYLAETGNLERAQKKAARDIASYWGPPPEPQQPMSEKELIETAQAKLNYEQDLNPPKVPMTAMERLQVKEQRMKLEKLKEEAKNPEKKPSDLVTQIGKETSTYLVKQKPMIGQLENAIKLAESPNVPINEKLASMKLIGKLMNSVMVGTSDAVSQDEAGILLAEVNEKIKPSGLWTSEAVFGNDLPQFVAKLKNLRDSVTNEYNNSIDLVSEIDPEISKIFKKKTLYSQPQAEGMPQGQPAANEPMKMTSPGAIPFVRDSTGKLIRQQ